MQKRKIEYEYILRYCKYYEEATYSKKEMIIKKSNKRIMLVANTSWYLLNFRIQLMMHLVSSGWEVIAVAPIDKYSMKIKKNGIKFMELPFSRKGTNPLLELLLIYRMLKIYRNVMPNLIHHFTPKAVIYGTIVARPLGIKCVNSVTGLGYAFINEGFLQFIATHLYKIALAGKNEVIFQNPDDRKLFINRRIIDIDRTHLIRGSGVDTEELAPSPTEKKENESITFTMISRMIWEKGVGIFIEAGRIVKEHYPNAKIRLVGGIDEGNPSSIPLTFLEKQKSSGLIDWTGHVDDVKSLIADSDVIVLPTYYREGVPRSLLEGASMAKPLIATDIPGCREIIKNDENGILVPPREVIPLACAMMRLAKNRRLRIQMGKDGRKKILKHFDVRKVTEKTLDVYEKVNCRRN